MKSLKGTQTAKNLLSAFAGESQARNRYIFYSQIADQEGYKQISDVFKLTANNEQGHAKIFFDILLKDFNDEDITITANYPIAQGTTLQNLQYSAKAENHEAGDIYISFAETAQKEGFPSVANTFKLISSIEHHHRDRFQTLATNIQTNKLFSKDTEEKWICRFCGYIFEGSEAPNQCPACQKPQGYYEIFREAF